jgi:type I restriction enzyme R subunit
MRRDVDGTQVFKQALDKLLPPEWTEAIYTENAADTIERPLVAELQLSEKREEDVRNCSKSPPRTRRF